MKRNLFFIGQEVQLLNGIFAKVIDRYKDNPFYYKIELKNPNSGVFCNKVFCDDMKEVINMNTSVVDDDIAIKLSNIANKLYRFQKRLWKEDRKSYNKIKILKVSLTELYEHVRNKVMSGNEISLFIANRFLDDIDKITEKFLNELPQYKETLELIKDEIVGLRVMITLTEHKKSIYNHI